MCNAQYTCIMKVSTMIFCCLVLCVAKEVQADASLAELDTRVGQLERDVRAWKHTTGVNQFSMIKDFKQFETSLKDELTGTFVPTLIRRLVNKAVTELLTDEYIDNIVSRRVLREVESLKSDARMLKRSFVQMRIKAESCMHGLQEIRLKFRDIQRLTSQLNQRRTKEDLLDSKEVITGLTEDINTLNTSSLMVRNEVESCVHGLQEIRLKLPIEIQSLTSQLNQIKEDLFDTKEVVNGPTEDVMTLNLTTTFPGTTAATTDPTPSSTVPPAPVTTQDSNLQASTTDAIEDLTPSKTVPPTPVTTQDSDAHATPSPATDRDLFTASNRGDLRRVKRILDAGQVDINARGRWSLPPVMAAARMGHRDVVQFLVGRGADVSLADRDGDNVLHLACVGGDLETVKLILSLDVVDINARTNYGNTAADLVRYWRHQRVLDLLVSRGAH